MERTYKSKYEQLKVQYMNAVDVAFRLGFEQGKQQAELDQVAQKQMEDQQMAQAAMSGAPGSPGAEGAPPESAAPGEEPQVAGADEMEPSSAHPDGSELDQHIAKLESLLGKSEVSPLELGQALSEIKSLRKAQVEAIELKKSAQAIKEISKVLHRPGFKLSVQASHNMNDNAKKAVTMQHRIVDDVMKAWDAEETKASKGIHQIIQVEGLTKKE